MSINRILVTGGAGYVGSIVSEELLKQGFEVVIMDNLQQGHKGAILPEAQFLQVDCGDPAALDEAFTRFQIDAVMHMAAETVVEFSMTDPRRYFHNNIIGGINLLDAMLKHNVKQMIFSSSAATYGEPVKTPIDEEHPQAPVNSYGETKLMFEKILVWYGRAYGLKHISFRYFNAAGASKRLGEDHQPETHLIPNILKAALPQSPIPSHRRLGTRGIGVEVFGTDYATKDGSCVRDYVHVIDIAQAHIRALGKLDEFNGHAYNLGNGDGYSVLEVVKATKQVTGKDIPTVLSPRRAGDPAVLLASSDKAKTELGWTPQFPELETIIASAWEWMKDHPEGYGD